MKSAAKKIIRPLVPQFILDLLNRKSEKDQIEEWERKGKPGPAPHKIKQITIREYQQNFGHNVLIETGTYKGDMVEAQKTYFNQVISIELGKELFKKAQNRFVNDKNVLIVQGDSGKVLSKVLKDVHEPAIFWLDGHYSAGITAKGDTECPIFGEVDAIFDGKKFNHILLIDDARLFNGAGDYPTLEKLTAYIKSKNSGYELVVKDDIIRYTI